MLSPWDVCPTCASVCPCRTPSTRLTQYALAPEWRGKGLGIPPMGQVIDACLKKGRPALRISCPDKTLRPFFARLGFVPTVGEDMEKDVRHILPPVPAAYRP